MPSFRKSVTYRLLVTFAIGVVLWVLPIVGFFMMLTDAASWMGWLLQLVLIAMFVEALLKRIPRILIALPLLAYGSYYAFYFSELSRIPAATEAMELVAAKELMKFDPAVHTLRTQVGITEILATYSISTAYVNSAKAIYRYTISDPHCDPPGTQDPPSGASATYAAFLKMFCFERKWIGPPDGPLVSVENEWRRPKVGLPALKHTLTVKLNGETVGESSSGELLILKPVPVLQLGCSQSNKNPNDNPCAIAFLHDELPVTAEGDPQRDAWRIGKMLSLQPRTPEEIEALVYVPAEPVVGGEDAPSR